MVLASCAGLCCPVAEGREMQVRQRGAVNLGPQFTHESRAEPCYLTSFHTVALWAQPSPCSICMKIISSRLAGMGLGLKSRLAPGGIPVGSCEGRAGREGPGGEEIPRGTCASG